MSRHQSEYGQAPDAVAQDLGLMLRTRGSEADETTVCDESVRVVLDPHGPRISDWVATLHALPDHRTGDETEAVFRMISEGCPNCGGLDEVTP